MQFESKNELDLKTMSSLALAFLGDGVYEMFVREYLITKGNSTVKRLHQNCVKWVCCEFQAKVSNEVLMDIFTEEEKDVYLRGRNAKVGHIPKNANIANYHAATAFESVFGYLYLKSDMQRLKFLFLKITEFMLEQE